MGDRRLKSIVIVGGGTAGWLAAAGLAARFGANGYTQITLVESDQIGTIGVGEATVPAIRKFLLALRIDEDDFMRRTNATYKLAIGFQGWAGDNTLFFHPFAEHGAPIGGTPFPQAWARAHQLGFAKDIDLYNPGSLLAAAGKFDAPYRNPKTGKMSFDYAYHFDAGLVAWYLNGWSRKRGVKRIEGKIARVHQHNESGDVSALELESGQKIEGDFFIDCSGFRGLLIEETLATGYDDWSHWLPCDRALAMPSETDAEPPSYTRALAVNAGWQWRIPLQNRNGNGYVYCSQFTDEEEAAKLLHANIGTAPLAEPRQLKFTTGIRKKIWNKNVFCLGLAGGFMEPLESTSIFLMQAGLNLLLNNFPCRDTPDQLRDEVNRRNHQYWEHIRDFIVLHYVLNKREGEPFWDACRHMAMPDTLRDVIDLYQATGKIHMEYTEFFRRNSWASMFAGFGIVPKYYHPHADDLSEPDLLAKMRSVETSMREAIEDAPSHKAYIEAHCPAVEAST